MKLCSLRSRPTASARICFSLREIILPKDIYRTECGLRESNHCKHSSWLISAAFPRSTDITGSILLS
eukprot:Gb_02689 [translate_table: standard]